MVSREADKHLKLKIKVRSKNGYKMSTDKLTRRNTYSKYDACENILNIIAYQAIIILKMKRYHYNIIRMIETEILMTPNIGIDNIEEQEMYPLLLSHFGREFNYPLQNLTKIQL